MGSPGKIRMITKTIVIMIHTMGIVNSKRVIKNLRKEADMQRLHDSELLRARTSPRPQLPATLGEIKYYPISF
jgi:hypothetical protein